MKKLPLPTSVLATSITDSAETLAAIGPVARSSVVDAVSERLRREILAGRITAGSRLPSERELSLALGVNRLTLRAALARLEAMGLVTTRHGSGTEVAPWRERAGLEALPMVIGALEIGEPAWLDLLSSLLEVRRVLASEAVALAALRHTSDDLEAMHRIATEQRARLQDPLAYARGDLAFQRALTHAAKNVGFELILNSFARFTEEQPDLISALYDKRETTVEFYGALIELVRAGDAESARASLNAAFVAMDEDWLARHGAKTSPRGESSPKSKMAAARTGGGRKKPR